MSKHKKIHFILIITYTIIIILGMIILPIIAKTTAFKYLLYSLLAFVVIGFLIISFYHSHYASYRCPNCKHQFKIGFFKDLVTFGSSYRGKVLTCPKCKEVNRITEEDK